LGIIVGSVASPTAYSRGGWLVGAWIWPILLWSQLGSREARYSTGSLIFSCPRLLPRQLAAVWMAGFAIAVLTGSGTAFRLLLDANWAGVLGWLSGALFIPSLALALGVWSGGGKAFEALYTVWWYIGPLHHTPGVDFAGTTVGSSLPVIYGLLAILLM